MWPDAACAAALPRPRKPSTVTAASSLPSAAIARAVNRSNPAIPAAPVLVPCPVVTAASTPVSTTSMWLSLGSTPGTSVLSSPVLSDGGARLLPIWSSRNPPLVIATLTGGRSGYLSPVIFAPLKLTPSTHPYVPLTFSASTWNGGSSTSSQVSTRTVG